MDWMSVAGVMNTNKIFPTMVRGMITDCNQALEIGVYGVNSSRGLANAPNDRIWGNLFVFKNDEYSSQLLYNSADAKTSVYSRIIIGNSTFTDWKRIDNFGYNSLADLAGGVAANNPRTINALKGKQLYRIGSCGAWGSGGFMASIGDGSNNDSSLVSVSYRLMGENAKVTYLKTGSVSLGVHIYKKIEDGLLNVYLYSSVPDNTYNPIIGLSSQDISLIGSNLDLSSYELVGSL